MSTATTTYEPRGYAAAAIEYLKALPPDTWIACAPLAHGIDVNPASEMHSILQTALKYGFVKKRKVEGLTQFALGDGTVVPQPEDEPLAPGEVLQLGTRIASIFPLAPQADAAEVAKSVTKPGRRGTKSPQTGTRPRKSVTPEPQTGPLRIALWADGILDIRRGEAPAIPPFNVDETRAIVAYLERMAVNVGEEGTV